MLCSRLWAHHRAFHIFLCLLAVAAAFLMLSPHRALAAEAPQKQIKLAQSLHEQLFSKRSSPSYWRERRSRDRYEDDDERDRYQYGDDDEVEFEGTGSYRTMCVRLCDGAYFPINYSVPGSQLRSDAAQCQSSCSMPARLFVYRNQGQDVTNMVDLAGRSYARITNAFRYRKELVPNCQCRPQPWSQVAKKTHKKYALEKKHGKKKRKYVKERRRQRSAERRSERNNRNYYDRSYRNNDRRYQRRSRRRRYRY